MPIPFAAHGGGRGEKTTVRGLSTFLDIEEGESRDGRVFFPLLGEEEGKKGKRTGCFS